MKTFILFGSMLVAAGLLFVNMYTSLVDARSWGSHIPDSISVAREYYRTVNPGYFFRIFSPLNQLLGLLVLVLFWKSSPGTRLFTVGAFALYVIAEGMTFLYFYPRNAVLFNTASMSDTALVTKTWLEWSRMNWVRSLVLLAGILCSCRTLYMYLLQQVK